MQRNERMTFRRRKGENLVPYAMEAPGHESAD